MRVIVHCDDPTDMILAMRAVKRSMAEGHETCAYGYGDKTVYAYRIKTGWSARVCWRVAA